ncbi:uncharacterized protein GGS22DRAFT_95223 [Annulohypoxylon maeteangense]|uniref:uncharacterized protein n=1 Tax=Annulohypoxylon maeteangense TaxID=1927788 RepID=UPI0020080584|nr:uncharacterized protein GGS22DRAFT_95223 [Annulohypoxylon maeteangense]KAI0888248.1 hypothetical protein GGS22DRAFT_95223 [Annulohypoxylon maeteangense]
MTRFNHLPSLLVFGPQTRFPSQEVLEDLRRELVNNPLLAVLANAATELPQFWETLVESDESLQLIPGTKYLNELGQWVKEGGPFPNQNISPNIYALPATILLQITQYTRYLRHLGDDSHRQVLESVKTAGIQGLCVGSISAAVVASSKTEADIGPAATAGLRLALAIGAYVDLDHISEYIDGFTCIAIRWREGNAEEKARIDTIIQSYPEAYISSINDSASVSVTLRTEDLGSFVQQIHKRSFQAATTSVNGRFHTSAHSDASIKLAKLGLKTEALRLPEAGMLLVPLRSTADGKIIREGSLTEFVIRNTLLKPADWYMTMKESTLQLPHSNITVVSAGFGNNIPPSLIRDAYFHVLDLGGTKKGKQYTNS